MSVKFKFESNAQTVKQRVYRAAQAGLIDAAHYGMDEVVLPVTLKDTGELKESKGVSQVKRFDTLGLSGEGYGIELGFKAPYAAHAHELPDSINPTTPNTIPKFLERPLRANEEALKEKMTQPLKDLDI